MKTNELVTKDSDHNKYIEQNLKLIQNQNNLNDVDLQNFAIQCKRTGLDPITRQIYAIPMSGRLNIMASIDGLRLIAERSGAYEGQTSPQWCGADGVWTDVWLKSEPPKACKVGVYKTKFREALIAIAIFDEYAKKDFKGNPEFMWKKMPALMIAKVAESLALRKAFPNEMSGIYGTEEMDQITKDVTPVVNTQAAHEGAKSEVKTQAKSTVKGYDFNSYTIQLGDRDLMSGTKLSDHKIEWLAKGAQSKIDWYKKNNKPMHKNTEEFVDMALAYIEFMKYPKVDSSETMKF